MCGWHVCTTHNLKRQRENSLWGWKGVAVAFPVCIGQSSHVTGRLTWFFSSSKRDVGTSTVYRINSRCSWHSKIFTWSCSHIIYYLNSRSLCVSIEIDWIWIPSKAYKKAEELKVRRRIERPQTVYGSFMVKKVCKDYLNVLVSGQCVFSAHFSLGCCLLGLKK